MMTREKKEDTAEHLFNLMPPEMLELTRATGADIVTRLGVEAVREIVLKILCGGNLRDTTESLTRRRIALLNAATLVTFMRGSKKDGDFSRHAPEVAAGGLIEKRKKWERWVLQWLLGLNDKAVQNILRDDKTVLLEYAKQYVDAQSEAAEVCEKAYGRLNGRIRIDGGGDAAIDWPFVIHLLATVGAQTLTIRGSEKSTYGKLFERLVLGALLHVLGFKYVAKKDLGDRATVDRCFWLASRKEKRESDATLLVEAGKGVRFDIGFIGRGNPEISLDKVSRFEREIELGREKWYMATIIIVDRIGKRSKIQELARDIDGVIVQMSMGTWPKEVARELARTVGYKHKLRNMSRPELASYLSEKMKDVPIEQFV